MTLFPVFPKDPSRFSLTRRPLAMKKAMLAALCGAAIIALILAQGSVVNGAAPAQETLSIRGRVVNGTAGASTPGDLVILMLITGPDGTLSGTGQTQPDRDGSFVLADVPRVASGGYNLSVDYGGVFYGRSLSADELDGEVIITVHEPTEDAGIITVQRQVMVISEIDVAQRLATATEFVRFSNPTDRTLRPNLETARPGMFSFMRFALPPDAADVTVQSNLRGGEIISVGSGFALTAAVPPGEHSVDFAYTFPYDGGSLDYRNSLPQGAGIFQILIPERWASVEIGGLTSRPPVGIGEKVYRAWEGRDIPPGPGVQLHLEGLPQPGVLARMGRTLSGGAFWTTAIPAAMGAALLALLTLGLARRYRPVAASETGADPSAPVSTSSGQADGPDATLLTQRAELVASLAALDERYQQGGLDEDDYLSQRAELVARALGEAPVTEAGN